MVLTRPSSRHFDGLAFSCGTSDSAMFLPSASFQMDWVMRGHGGPEVAGVAVVGGKATTRANMAAGALEAGFLINGPARLRHPEVHLPGTASSFHAWRKLHHSIRAPGWISRSNLA